MDDGDALLRAIIENPLDETVRLIYADYLDERNHNNDSWLAAMIRGQWRSGGPAHWVTTFPTVVRLMNDRNANLKINGYRYHEPAVIPNDDDPPTHPTFHIHRGFLYRIDTIFSDFMSNHRDWFNIHPITEINFIDHPPQQTTGLVPALRGHWFNTLRGLPQNFFVPNAVWGDIRDSIGAMMPTRKLAQQQMSRYAVNWARNSVGLPMLEWPEPIGV
jgi:uncharacterized protein (TIGR02996 family)